MKKIFFIFLLIFFILSNPISVFGSSATVKVTATVSSKVDVVFLEDSIMLSSNTPWIVVDSDGKTYNGINAYNMIIEVKNPTIIID